MNNPQTHSWNQQVLSNEGSFFLKETKPLMWFELMPDWYPPTKSQTHLPLYYYVMALTREILEKGHYVE